MSILFESKLAESLDFGHILEIGAKAENEESWFSVSLATGRCNGVEQFDIGFQMLVKLSDEQVVFKQQLNMVWLEVDRENFDTAVFRHPFRILIVLDETKYLIAVNGESQWRMRYGLPVQKLNSLKVEGHLMAIKQVHHRKYFPYTWPMLQLPEDHLHFSHDIPVSFEPGHVMVILMKLQGKIDGRFNIDFRNLKHIEEIEVHFSVRFHSRTIVRNSMLHILDLNADPECPARIDWGYEERNGPFPFDDLSKSFKLAIGLTENSVKMAKDGIFLFEYAFRRPNVLPYIGGMQIKGVLGMMVRVSAIDHFHLDDPMCEGFEQYSDS